MRRRASGQWGFAFMFIRTPGSNPLANSSSRIALVLRSERSARVYEIGDRTVAAIILIAALLFAWFLVATTYLFFRDEVVLSAFSGQRQSQHAYEDRILELRARIDRITTRQLVNQDTIEDRVAGLVARQAELEARQIMVADLGARAEKAGFGLTQRAATDTFTGALPFSAPSRPRPLPDLPAASLPSKPTPQGARSPMESIVGEVETRAGRMDQTQRDILGAIGDAALDEIAKGRKAVAALGLDPSRFGKNALAPAPIRRLAPLDEFQLRDVSQDNTGTALGGPLLPPLASRADAEAFDAGILRAEQALDGATKARAVLRALPVGRPIAAGHDLTSGFGTRLDPFTRSLAMHSGIDFRAPTGTSVRAVAAGKVIEAGYNGGYGRMVEIDHGFGITTRYAHMSSIAVSEGDRVEKGALLGAVGSTGRSTGPHLHYEVRIDDDATDPMRFVRAQALLAGN